MNFSILLSIYEEIGCDKMKKMIFLDIDGTLISKLGKVSKKVYQAIKKAQKNGNLVFLCTGRARCAIKNLEYIGFDGYICFAGSYIEINHHIIDQHTLSNEMVKKVSECFERNHVYYNYETEKAVYQDTIVDELYLFGTKRSHINVQQREMIRQSEKDLGVLPFHLYHDDIDVYKMCFIALKKGDLEQLKKEFNNDFHIIIHDDDQVDVILGEIIPKGFDKGQAIEKVVAYLNASLEDTICFGDSMNDLPMIEKCHYSVAMENGHKELKKHADAICESVENDGIYHELKRLKLLEEGD